MDDDPAMRRAFNRLLEAAGHSVELYAGAQEFLGAYDPRRPGCLVIDVLMPGLSGIELHEWLLANGHAIPVIMITGYGQVSVAVDAMRRGAFDFLEKPFRTQAFLDRVFEGIARDAEIRQERAQRARASARLDSLSPCERKVMDLIVRGNRGREIASILCVSYNTISKQRNAVMQKTQAKSVAELVRLAMIADETRYSDRRQLSPTPELVDD